jgi:hypothetical protein
MASLVAEPQRAISYHTTQLYDGLGSFVKNSPPSDWQGEFDDYDAWFSDKMPGKDPQASLTQSRHEPELSAISQIICSS